MGQVLTPAGNLYVETRFSSIFVWMSIHPSSASASRASAEPLMYSLADERFRVASTNRVDVVDNDYYYE